MNSIPKDQHSRCSTLKEMLVSPGLAFLMEAHDGLSAKIVEKSGHAGIWASGLSISTALGLRDCNEAAWTQMQASVEMMADAVTIPILVDGDSGYGNFNNARRVATKFEQAGASGICIEDKLFPKMNSFRGERQALAEKYEFCGRIRAIKDSQRDKDFVLVARTEALISGYSMQEALDRCSYYSAAGADAILIHSKKTTPHEILEFLSAWKNHSPVVIVPTTYCQTSSDTLERAGASLAIWANHTMRASAQAMLKTCLQIKHDRGVQNIESEISSLKEIFSLFEYDRLDQEEVAYLSKQPFSLPIDHEQIAEAS